MRRGRRAGLLTAGVLAVAATPALGATIKVTTASDPITETPGNCSLREAIRAAQDDAPYNGCRRGNGPDKVQVKAGTVYGLSASMGALGMPGEITILAQGKGRATIDADGTNEGAFVVDGTQNRVRDLVIRGGDSQIGGGGIHVTSGAQLSLLDSVVKGNFTDHANGGGGIYAGPTAELRVARSTVANNTAEGAGGGGIAAVQAALDVSRSTISGNRANSGSADGGGALVLNPVSSAFNDSTIAGNRTTGNGGGLMMGGGTLITNNMTVSDNAADTDNASGGQGGGAFVVSGATLSLRNSIIGDNAAPPGAGPDCQGSLSIAYTLLSDGAGCSVFPTPDNVIGEAPRLKSLARNGGPTRTMALKPSSPARNSAHPDEPGSGGLTCSPKDQRGVNRPVGPRCDMGAYEG